MYNMETNGQKCVKQNLDKIKHSRMDQVIFFKSYLTQILLGKFLNTLSLMKRAQKNYLQSCRY